MSAKKSKTFFKTLTAILVLLLFFGGYYIYSSGIFGASVTENISEHSITDEKRLIEYEEYGITYDESSQSYLYQDSLIKNLRDALGRYNSEIVGTVYMVKPNQIKIN